MNGTCEKCRYGTDAKPGGQRPQPGTVWCAKLGTQMGKLRSMPCFTSAVLRKRGRCFECRHARITKPSGSALTAGFVWCDKKHSETKKLRSMECFEPSG